jgi:hypothetical protein
VGASTCEVAIIGAGPYGLAATAHLRQARIDTRTIGIPMDFWEHHTPAGMWLRSPWSASHISDPHGDLTLDQYQASLGARFRRPLPREHFVAYGHWFQQQAAPDVDRRLVTRIESAPRGFRVRFADEDTVEARRVIVATGLAGFAYRPPEFANLPPELVTHSSDHGELKQYAGRRVAVIGSGQSAIEIAALLHELGAEVEVIHRSAKIKWLTIGGWIHRNAGPFLYLLYPPSDVGPPVINHLVSRPDMLRQLPKNLQRYCVIRSTLPSATDWLEDRMRNVPLASGRRVVRAEATGERLALTLDDRSQRLVDHAILATGFRIDVKNHALLAPELAQAIRCDGGDPVLRYGFESSVPGLHFLGSMSVGSFGPLVRFVAGTDYTGHALAFALRRRMAPRPIPSPSAIGATGV